MAPILTLTSDFGSDSPYVAQMKAAALAVEPTLTIVDITHAISPQDVRQGAVVLEDCVPRFPEGTVHVAVVDPGVGTERAIVGADLGGQRVIAPDNGLLTRLARVLPPRRVHRLQGHGGPTPSATFHGRDIMAPAGARLCQGLALDRLGPAAQLTLLDWPPPQLAEGRIDGHVLLADSFGNLITDIGRAMLPKGMESALRIACAGHEVQGLVRTYGDRAAGDLVALIGSSDRLELAVVQGSARQRLGAGSPALVQVRWQA